MPLPTIVANTQVKILDAETVQALTTQKKLAFTMQTQAQTEWCWAAVSASVSAYFNPQSTWTQCAVVMSQLDGINGCTECSTPACNQPYYLSWGLLATGNLAKTQNSTVPYQTVSGEINATRPLCCRIAWKGGGAHYVALYGYHTVKLARYVDVADSLYGKSTYRFEVFTRAYQHVGSWSNTYFVQSGAEASTCP